MASPAKATLRRYTSTNTGAVQTAAYRMSEAAKPKPKPKSSDGGDLSVGAGEVEDTDVGTASRPRPDVTRKGIEMIGDLRTDALHDALAHAPIEEDTLTALPVLAFAGTNVTVASGADGHRYGFGRMAGTPFG